MWCCSDLTSFSHFFNQITVSGCHMELLKCFLTKVSCTRHDITPSHIILTLGPQSWLYRINLNAKGCTESVILWSKSINRYMRFRAHKKTVTPTGSAPKTVCPLPFCGGDIIILKLSQNTLLICFIKLPYLWPTVYSVLYWLEMTWECSTVLLHQAGLSETQTHTFVGWCHSYYIIQQTIRG